MYMRHFYLVMLSLTLGMASAVASDWKPPENPDPQKILSEASADARAGRYEDALAKHLWFHENAIKINPGMSGVRLSFALSYWMKLGMDYPPALDKLQQIRDELQARAEAAIDLKSEFHDLVAINRELDEESKTVDAFKILDAKNPEAAKRAFIFSKQALIKEKQYVLYVKYVDPTRDFEHLKRMYELTTERAKDPKFGSQLKNHAKRSFRNETATLVAVLTLNDRKAEATEVAASAKKVLDDAKFHAELDAALAGTVPKSWP